MRLVQRMYANARSHVHIGEGYSKEFEVKVSVHQGSVLSPLLFIIMLETSSREFCSGVPWEDLYADDLVIIAELLEECVRRLLTWKEAMEKKGLRVNAGKMKICSTGLDLLQSSGEFPCVVCPIGVGSNSIFCNGCKHWVHKKCSGLKRLTKDPDYKCTWCQGIAWKKFKELLPVLSSCHLSFKTCGHVYSSCVRNAMLHASETKPPSAVE